MKLKAGVSTLEFCMDNYLCFITHEYVITDNLSKTLLPICNIENDCKYHGQLIPNGRHICDYLLKEMNEKMIEGKMIKKTTSPFRVGGTNV